MEVPSPARVTVMPMFEAADATMWDKGEIVSSLLPCVTRWIATTRGSEAHSGDP